MLNELLLCEGLTSGIYMHSDGVGVRLLMGK